MSHEILALLPEGTDLPSSDKLTYVAATGFTAAFVPAQARFDIGKALRRRRLAAASERQALLELLMEGGTVLPFAPGSVIDKHETEALVRANAGMLGGLARHLEGRVQYQVTVEWAEDRVLERFREAPEIAPLFSTSSVSAKAVAAAVARLAERLAGAMAAQLRSVAVEEAELPHSTGMLSNFALLLDQDKLSHLEAILEEIDAIWSDGFRIRQVGPSPATSFATLRLRRHDARDIQAAFRTLGLSAPVSEAAIRERRQRLLKGAGGDAQRVRAAAQVASAAYKLGAEECGLHLLERWSEGQAAPVEMERVA